MRRDCVPYLRCLALSFGSAALGLGGSGCSRQPKAPASPAASPPAQQAAAPEPAPPPRLSVEQARALLVEAAKTAPDDPHALLELGLFDRNTNNLDGAEQELLACWRRFPRLARAPYHLGMLYLMNGRESEALAPLQAAAALAPNDAQIQVYAGDAAFRTRHEDLAKRYLQAAIKADPQTSEAYLLLARINDRLGTSEIALENLRRYIACSPNPATGYYLMGRIYAQRASRENAELWLKRAVEADPNNPMYWTTLGRVYFELSNATKADEGIRCYEKALALAPDAPDTHRFMGRALLEQKRYAEAATHLEKALHGASDPGPIYYDFGQALLKAGRTEEGQRALATYQRFHDYSTGVTRLQRAVEAAPKDRARRYELARFCLTYRQFDLALMTLRETERLLGADAALRSLEAEIQAARATAQSGPGGPGASGLPGALVSPTPPAPNSGVSIPPTGATDHGR